MENCLGIIFTVLENIELIITIAGIVIAYKIYESGKIVNRSLIFEYTKDVCARKYVYVSRHAYLSLKNANYKIEIEKQGEQYNLVVHFTDGKYILLSGGEKESLEHVNILKELSGNEDNIDNRRTIINSKFQYLNKQEYLKYKKIINSSYTCNITKDIDKKTFEQEMCKIDKINNENCKICDKYILKI